MNCSIIFQNNKLGAVKKNLSIILIGKIKVIVLRNNNDVHLFLFIYYSTDKTEKIIYDYICINI